MISEGRRDSVGGGVVAEFFRDLKSRRDSDFQLVGPFYQELSVNGALLPEDFH